MEMSSVKHESAENKVGGRGDVQMFNDDISFSFVEALFVSLLIFFLLFLQGSCARKTHDSTHLYNTYYQWVSIFLMVQVKTTFAQYA